MVQFHLPRREPVAVDNDRLNRILGRTRQAKTTPVDETRVLVWHDAWRNRDRVLRWQGPCLGCQVQTWAFDDGENDPRGILGDAALWTVTVESYGIEVEVRACALCANDYDRYKQVQRSAIYRGIRTAVPYNFGAGKPYQAELIEAWGFRTDDNQED